MANTVFFCPSACVPATGSPCLLPISLPSPNCNRQQMKDATAMPTIFHTLSSLCTNAFTDTPIANDNDTAHRLNAKFGCRKMNA